MEENKNKNKYIWTEVWPWVDFSKVQGLKHKTCAAGRGWWCRRLTRRDVARADWCGAPQARGPVRWWLWAASTVRGGPVTTPKGVSSNRSCPKQIKHAGKKGWIPRRLHNGSGEPCTMAHAGTVFQTSLSQTKYTKTIYRCLQTQWV